jgi:hypothetical protein
MTNIPLAPCTITASKVYSMHLPIQKGDRSDICKLGLAGGKQL